MKDILKAKFLQEFIDTASNMYRLGWDERNGGNISYMLSNSEVNDYLKGRKVVRVIPLPTQVKEVANTFFLVTGTGKYFKNIKNNPEENLGIFKISEDGANALLYWGYKDGGQFTSELPSHLLGHITRLRVDKNQKVILHCHPTNLVAMTYTHELDSIKFTHTLWQMSTECIVVFPEGVNVLPWMLCGTEEIGIATAKAFETSRVVVWGMHGIYASGITLDETFGLIETVEKAATIFNIISKSMINTISDENLSQLARHFKVTPRENVLFSKSNSN